MKKWNVKLNFTPDEWVQYLKRNGAKKDSRLFRDHFNGEMEFSIELPDDWASGESQRSWMDEFSLRGIPICQYEPVSAPGGGIKSDEFYITGAAFQDDEGHWLDPIMAYCTLDPDYRSIPDQYNEKLITVGAA